MVGLQLEALVPLVEVQQQRHLVAQHVEVALQLLQVEGSKVESVPE